MGSERLSFPPNTFKPSEFSGDSDTAPVGFDLGLRGRRLQAAQRSGCAWARCRASNARPITCRL
jgi:hypothetical protein